ncbi:MAG: methyltransferase domain-containing protein [Bacteroidales bacterium]|nr:methyltransferase domain-containing protein [Bacteroidales bacterium]
MERNMPKQESRNTNNNIIYLSEPSSVSMDDEWYEITDKDHFWMKWRFVYISKYVNSIFLKEKRVLEIGCGNGINMQMFELNEQLIIDGCDLNEKALKMTPDLKGKKYLYNIHEDHPLMVNKYDFVLLSDVIEHIKDDKGFIIDSLKSLKMNGSLLINVPANKFLFSRYDQVIGHERRYGKDELTTLLESLGLQIEYINHWGFFLVPVVILRKLLFVFTKKKTTKLGFKPFHPIINKAFLVLMKIETKYFPNPIIGTSLFAVAKKIKD